MDVNELIELVSTHLEPLHSGKVRDSFRVFGPNRELWRLIIVTDRRSIFDFKLGFTVPQIGEILNVTNIFFRNEMDIHGIEHDMVAYGCAMDRFLPSDLRIPDVQKRGMLVRELDMIPVECVARNYLTGTGLTQYKNNKNFVCGQDLGSDLINGSPLQTITFTPTTKADKGHDLPMDVKEVFEAYPDLEGQTVQMFHLVDSVISQTKRFMWVDGKAEGGIDPVTGRFVWGDEIGTFDSSRIWVANEYNQKWPDSIPTSYDKQLLREWGKTEGIDGLDPENELHAKLVLELIAPENIIYQSRVRALEYFRSLSHYSCRDFQQNVMGIAKA